ncbi:hypothetical protein HY995_05165 [Candidatus Micrarchaeota archaeon]|nr:hypothetical protein [Candidatus Micrarchaeota archaeon]
MKVECALDKNKHQTGMRISDEQHSKIKLDRDSLHGDWNYVTSPNTNRPTYFMTIAKPTNPTNRQPPALCPPTP